MMNVDGIYGKGELEQRSAPMGHGSYVSSNWESMYGDFVFALDFSAEKHSFPGSWFNGFSTSQTITDPYNNTRKVIPSIWIRVEKNIPINEETLSFVIIRSPDLLRDPRHEEISEKYNPVCLTLGQFEAIRAAFLRVIEDDSTMKRSLPPLWKKLSSWGDAYSLPEEFIK